LIQRFRATIRRLDTEATGTAPGYDHVFREVVRTDTDGDGIGEPGRAYHPEEVLTCQMDPTTLDSLRGHALGQDPDYDVVMLFHFRELEALGFVGSGGMATIQEGTRLVKVEDLRGGLVYSPRDTEEGGLEVTHSSPVGWGLCMASPSRNLLEVRFSRRGIS
jgi:hypothetical protein